MRVVSLAYLQSQAKNWNQTTLRTTEKQTPHETRNPETGRGTSLSGEYGTVFGTIIGALTIGA